jgi:hypothetical protein
VPSWLGLRRHKSLSQWSARTTALSPWPPEALGHDLNQSYPPTPRRVWRGDALPFGVTNAGDRSWTRSAANSAENWSLYNRITRDAHTRSRSHAPTAKHHGFSSTTTPVTSSTATNKTDRRDGPPLPTHARRSAAEARTTGVCLLS